MTVAVNKSCNVIVASYKRCCYNKNNFVFFTLLTGSSINFLQKQWTFYQFIGFSNFVYIFDNRARKLFKSLSKSLPRYNNVVRAFINDRNLVFYAHTPKPFDYSIFWFNNWLTGIVLYLQTFLLFLNIVHVVVIKFKWHYKCVLIVFLQVITVLKCFFHILLVVKMYSCWSVR